MALEIEHLGCTHAQIGAYLMSIWGLPAPLVLAVALHHEPRETLTRFSALTAVHCADAIVAEKDSSTFNQDIEMDMAYVERLELSERVQTWRGLFEQPTIQMNGGD